MLQWFIKLIVIIVCTSISLKLVGLKRAGSDFLNSVIFKKTLYYFVALTLFIVRVIWFTQVFKDHTWGKLLHAELSNFSSTVILIGLVLRKDGIVKLMLPWFLIAGMLPLVFNNVWHDDNFLGTLFSYIGHAMMYLASMMLVLTVTHYSKKDFINAYLVIWYFLAYVFVVSGIPYIVTGNLQFGVFATGMLPPSYESQEVGKVIINHYVFLSELSFGIYPIGTVLFYTFASVMYTIGAWMIKRIQEYIGIQVPVLEKVI